MPEVEGAAALESRVETLLDRKDAEHLEVWSGEGREASTRFANNAITQNVVRQTHTVEVRAAYGLRVGSASTSDVSAEGLLTALRRAEAIARASAEDLEYLPPPGPQVYPKVEGFDQAAADVTPEARAEAIREAVSLARARGAEAFGSYTARACRDRLWNSSGLRFDHESTSLLYANTVVGAGTTGGARHASHALEGLDTRGAAEKALEKATRFAEAEDLPPGEYTVILEPAAFADLLSWVQWTLDAKQADEGWSAWQGKVGTQVCTERLSMRSVPGHPLLPGYPAIEGGLASPTVAWIERGHLRTLAYSRFWARKCGVEPTGHPGNLVVETDDPSGARSGLRELIGGVSRGVLVTRFWYTNFVDEMTLTITGMTRDGLFRIEDGEIVGALRNVRFNDSPLSFLHRVTEFGPPEVTVGESDEPVVCPPVRIEGFHFTSGTSF